ncbi:hypothetical protein Tco_0474405 [Tanacetum coccineum]
MERMLLLLLAEFLSLRKHRLDVAYHAKDPGPSWLSKMYRLRSSWIPAFFVDSPLCGLMRTTSRRTCPGKDNPDALYPAVLVSGSNDHADGGSRDGSSGSGSV